MANSLLNSLGNIDYLFGSPLLLAILAFQIWMLIHALRNREWLWALFIFVGWGIAALWYYFQVYHGSAATMNGFQLPGAQSRARIKELQAKIHHVDNAYQHFQLGDVYFQKGKLAQAEQCYREALARDVSDIDTRAHLGQCLLRLQRATRNSQWARTTARWSTPASARSPAAGCNVRTIAGKDVVGQGKDEDLD